MINELKVLIADDGDGLKGEEVKVLDVSSDGQTPTADCLILSRNKRIITPQSNLNDI